MTGPDGDAPFPAPPAPPRDRGDGWRIAALLAVAVALHAWVIANTSVTARDSIGFARYANNLADPTAAGPDPARTRRDVLKEEKHPPAYPASVWAVSAVVKAVWKAPLADQMLLSAQLAGAVAGVLLVLPTYWLGRQLFDRTVGFWAAAAFQLLPVAARDTSDGLSEGLFLLCTATALACGVWAVRGATVRRFFLCGLAAGAAYLVRPEGGAVPLAVAAVAAVQAFTQRWSLVGAFVRVAAVAVGFLVVGGPYMAVIGKYTNKPALNTGVGDAEGVANAAGAVAGPPFAEWITPPDATGPARVGLAAAACGKEYLKTTNYGLGGFAVVGFLLTARRVLSDSGGWVPVLFAALHLGVLVFLANKQGYVSERHLLPVALVAAVFATGGLRAWFLMWARVPGFGVFRWVGWSWLVMAGMTAATVIQLWRPLHADRLGHKAAGQWLADDEKRLSAEDKAGVVVIDNYDWASYFAGRTAYLIPPDPPLKDQRVLYGVLEFKDGEPELPKDENDKDRHDRHLSAVNVFRADPATAVFHWPENEPRERWKVVVVKRVNPR